MMNKKSFFDFSVKIIKGVFLFFSLSFFSAQAYDAPRVYVKEINLDKIFYESGQEIKGNFTVWNTESAITDMDYVVSLRRSNSSYSEDLRSFSKWLSPDETIKENISYTIPKNLKSGEYKFRIQLFSKTGAMSGWLEKNINIKSNNVYLILNETYMVLKGENFEPGAGISFGVDEKPKIKFSVYNGSAMEIKFKPEISVHWFQENLDVKDRFLTEENVLSAGAVKNLEIDLPQYQKPGSYLAKVTMLSGDQKVSSTKNFRWVVKGDGATILAIKSPSDSFEQNKEAQIKINLVGPADASDIGQATLRVNILDEKGDIVKTIDREIKLDENVKEETVSFTPVKTLLHPVIEAKIIKNEKELGVSSISFADRSGEAEKLPEVKKNTSTKFVIVLIAILAIFVAGILIFKNKKTMFLIILALGFWSFGATQVFAAADIVWSTPIQDEVFNKGGLITFSGTINITACNNDYKDANVQAYICDYDQNNCTASLGSFSSELAINPYYLSYDTENKEIYISDWVDSKIIRAKISASGDLNIIETLGSFGSGAGQFKSPQGISYDKGYIYVADSGNFRIARFQISASGGIDPVTWKTYLTDKAPISVYSDSPSVYITDVASRVLKFNSESNGADKKKIISEEGSEAEKLKKPAKIFYDKSSKYKYIYVADTENHRIVRFQENNVRSTWQAFGTPGSSEGEFNSPSSVYFDQASEYVYVVDRLNYRLVKFKITNAGAIDLTSWSEFAINDNVSPDKSGGPFDLIYNSGFVYVSDVDYNYKNKDQIIKIKDDFDTMTEQVFNLQADGYKINATVPLTFPAGFVFGGAGNDEVYAKIYADITKNDDTKETVVKYERIKISNSLVNAPPTIDNIEILPPTPVQLCQAAYYSFGWVFKDSNDTQSQYQIQVASDSNFEAGSLVIDKCGDGAVDNNTGICANIPGNLKKVTNNTKASSGNFSLKYPFPVGYATPPNQLAYGQQYFLRIQVWDSAGASSGWTNYDSNPFDSIEHPYPTVGFTPPAPNNLIIDIPYGFKVSGNASDSDNSFCYEKTATGIEKNISFCSSWFWNFGDFSTSNEKEPTHIYTKKDSYGVTLTITDQDGKSCSNKTPEFVNISPSSWKEVIPIDQ